MHPTRLTALDRRDLLAMASVVVALHIAGCGLLFSVIVPGHYGTAAVPVGAGIGLTAYVLGMRHAFDADHIAAIDNVTRRLIHTGKRRPLAVGFYFSAGHSSVVFALAVLLAFGLHGIVGALFADNSSFARMSAVLGGAISGAFLLIVAAINVHSLLTLRLQARSGGPDGAGSSGGLLSRALRRPMLLVSRPRHMYPVGFLFGLGFDTATEVGLLVVAVTSVAVGVPWYGMLCLPLLFAAGMILFDSLDGIFVTFAYGWALGGSARRLRYNVIVTLASIAVALGVGAIEVVSAVAQGFAWRGAIPVALNGLDLNFIGLVVVISLGLLFLTVLILRRTRRLERADTEPPESIESRDASVAASR